MSRPDRSTVGTPGVGEETLGSTATDTFAVLGNETRLTILLELWRAYDPFPDGTSTPTAGGALSFSELRERVGMRDSGQFNYHLDKLDGHFVGRTDGGYTLLPAGQTIVKAIIASAGFEETTLEPTVIDLPCSHCGAPTAITYQNQRMYHVCTDCDGSFALGDDHPDGVLGGWTSSPAFLQGRTPDEIFTSRKTEHLYLTALRAAGICTDCSGPGELTLHVCEDHTATSDEPCSHCGRHFDPAVRFVCMVCKNASLDSVVNYVRHHPATVAFFYDHGIAFGYPHVTLETALLTEEIKHDAEQELLSHDPPRVRVTISHDGEELQLTFDETVNVIDVTASD